MATLDVFRNNAFGTGELTEAINVFPNRYGRLNALNLFPAKGIRKALVTVERKNGILNLLPTVPRGGPATKNIMGHRDMLDLRIPHIPLEDLALAEEVQDVRKFGSEADLESVQDLVNDKLETMAAKHDITLEWYRWQALKGLILDTDDSVIADLFDSFGITQHTQNFVLSSATTEVVTVALNVSRYMETHAFGETISGVLVFASSGWFDAFTTHALVKDAYKYFQTNQQLGGDYRSGFRYGGLIIQEENGSATLADGTVKPFVDANEAIAIPLGTSSTFKTYFAPADFIETVNTVGLPRYAKQERMEFDRGIKLHSQSNPLPVCLRPQLLVRLTKS